MNENEIINQNPEPTPIPDIEKPPSGVPDQGIDLKTKLDLFQTLDINMQLLGDDETNMKIRDIYDWGAISGISEDQMIIALNEISSKIGRAVDKTLFESTWEWVRLDTEMKKIQSKMRSMEKING